MIKNKQLEEWLKFADNKTKKTIRKMNDQELKAAFTHSLSFGTAGIRGIMGVGPNRINKITIAEAAYGYGKYVIKKYGINSKIIIGTDNRFLHKTFARITAKVLSSMQIKVFIKLILPTPMVSFAIRELKAQGAVIITASHNPPEYNGFKVYNHEGGQLLPQDTAKVSIFINKVENFFSLTFKPKPSLIKILPKFVISNYINEIIKLGQTDENKKLKIVFSPQHGTSAKYMPKILKRLGYKVICVKEQMKPDPMFKATKSPNPEDVRAYELAIKYAQKHQADLIIITDPDADRIGVAAIKNNNYEIINGNQFASIIFSDMLKSRTLSKKSLLIYSDVSSSLPSAMAYQHNIKAIPVATGFKWVSNVIDKYQDLDFIFGFEESYGCLIDGNIARDKDSFQAAALIAKVANQSKKQHQILWENLDNIFKTYGYFEDTTITETFKGADFQKQQSNFIARLRDNFKLPTNRKYIFQDLQKGDQEIAPMNMVKFIFKNNSQISIRPSGTEPKVKFYINIGPIAKKDLPKELITMKNIVKKVMEKNAKN